ncbi:MAG TPA: Gfo/Idh/MocA family oxidoreductase [Candidatus Bathyarchaeia archaeon]|nr:Gfo/Idh/MocA family oxidoreductase [Candidatus Bathyarchaeia archaeon]
MRIGRREFLWSSALAASAAASIGAANSGGKQKIRCGILGLGHAHALDVLGVLKRSEDFELTGVVEPDAAVCAQVKKSPVLRAVPWLEQAQLLSDETIKMIAIESAVPRLLDHAQAAANAGKHIHLDKPAGTSLPQFRALLDTMEQRGLLLQMGYMFRYNAGFDFARRVVSEGVLGDIYRIHGCMDTDYTKEKRDLLEGRPGGMMFELGCHLLDMTMLILGTPKKITPFLRHDAKTNDGLLDNTAAVFEFDDAGSGRRAMAILQSSAMRPNAFPSRRFEVCGTNGSVTIEPLEPPSVTLNLRKATGEFKRGIQQIPVPDHDRHVRDFEDLAGCIRGNAQFAYSKQHDFEVQRTLLLASGADV